LPGKGINECDRGGIGLQIDPMDQVSRTERGDKMEIEAAARVLPRPDHVDPGGLAVLVGKRHDRVRLSSLEEATDGQRPVLVRLG